MVTLRCKQYPRIQWNTTVLQHTSCHAPWGIHHGPWAICGPRPCALAQESPRPWPRPEPCVDGYPIGVYGIMLYYVAFHSLVQGAKEGSNSLISSDPPNLACMQNLEPCDAVQFVDVRFSSALVRAAVGRFGRCRYRGGSVTSDRRTSRFFEVWLQCICRVL